MDERVREELDMGREELRYLVELAKSGGPTPEHYEELNQTWPRIMGAVRSGDLPMDLVRDTWLHMGEAFGDETMQGFGIRKPHGYAGDFEMIDRIYRYSLCEKPHIRRWDEYFQSREACQAVRNRKDYFVSLMNAMSSKHETLRVLNVGCGPARDVLEYCSHGNGIIKFECVDMDDKAISYAKNVCSNILDHVTFHHCNIFRYRDEKPYELIWSAGLFDYLDDKSFIMLLRRLYKMLKPEGQIIVGNFSTKNPTRDYMEFGEWFLRHRTEEELLSLAEATKIKDISAAIGKEPQGINLFLHISKKA